MTVIIIIVVSIILLNIFARIDKIMFFLFKKGHKTSEVKGAKIENMTNEKPPNLVISISNYIISSVLNTIEEKTELISRAEKGDGVAVTFKRYNDDCRTAYEIGAILIRGGKIEKEFFSRFKPIQMPSKSARALLDDAFCKSLESSTDFADIWKDLCQLFEDKVIITKGIHPDFSILLYLCEKNNIELPGLINIFTGGESSYSMLNLVRSGKELEKNNALWYARTVAESYIHEYFE